VDIVNLMLYFMCVEWNCHYFVLFICCILACSCVVCLGTILFGEWRWNSLPPETRAASLLLTFRQDTN